MSDFLVKAAAVVIVLGLGLLAMWGITQTASSDDYSKIQHQVDMDILHAKQQCEADGGSYHYDPNFIPNYTCIYVSK